jgi:hypothetical protein
MKRVKKKQRVLSANKIAAKAYKDESIGPIMAKPNKFIPVLRNQGKTQLNFNK